MQGDKIANMNEITPDLQNERVKQPANPASERPASKNEQAKSVEHTTEQQEKTIENARHEIERIAAEHEPSMPEKASIAPQQNPEHKIDTKLARNKAYESIMQQAHQQMSPSERRFSKLIHHPIVEKVSDITGNTIARPTAVLSGAIASFLLTLIIYIVAKQSGYPLTGTESIAAFIFGWIIGNIIDFAKTLLRGR